MKAQRWIVSSGVAAILATVVFAADVGAQPCYEGICASPIVCNECGDWEDDHSNHLAPIETTHDFETDVYFPYRPSGGAAPGEDYDVTVYWRSYHRAMNKGKDGGHCAKFCAYHEVPFDGCTSFWGLDGIGLSAEKTRRRGGVPARSITHARIDGTYQNDEGKWEWPEQGWQSGNIFGDTYPCAGFAGGHHDWASRPTDILAATYRVYDWSGITWGQYSDYELYWDEGDTGGNDDLDFRITASQPGVVALGKAVETCLKYGAATDRFTIHRDAVLMLCENRNLTDRCDDHLFEIWFDVQCKWVTAPDCLDLGEPCNNGSECCSGNCQFVYKSGSSRIECVP